MNMKNNIVVFFAVLCAMTILYGCTKKDDESIKQNDRLADAILRQDFDEMKTVLHDIANINVTLGDKGQTFLLLAAVNTPPASVEMIKLLISKGADVNATNNNDITPLMRASFAGIVPNVQVLLENDANITLKDKRGLTALHHAARRGHESTCNLLLKAGADPTAKDINGETPIDWAEKGGYRNVVTLLKEYSVIK